MATELSAGCAGAFPGDFAALKERQLVFLLARQLAEAQFRRADRPASERLWQEVAALGIDPERITALLYGTDDLHDPIAMERIDRPFRMVPARAAAGRLPLGRSPAGWFGRFGMSRSLKAAPRGGGHRSAPPADPPARR